MKRTASILLIALGLLAAACNSEEKQIRQNAQAYLDATGAYDMDEAMKYATHETCEQTLAFIRDVVIPMTDSTYIMANQPATIVIDSLNVLAADTAEVYYTKTTPITHFTGTLQMVKVNNQWLAYLPISLPMDNPEDVTDTISNNQPAAQ